MKAREITFDHITRGKIKKGIDMVCDTVKVTIGPRGRNVLLQTGGRPEIVNDGGVIADGIHLKDNLENMGAEIAKGVVRETSRAVGGGRTASAIMLQSIVDQGMKTLQQGTDMIRVKKGMDLAYDDIVKGLTKSSREVKGRKELMQIATISTQDEKLATAVVDVVEKVGKNGVITVLKSNNIGITHEVMEGLEFQRGYVSDYMMTNSKTMEAEYLDIPILVTSRRLSLFKDVVPLIEGLMKKGKNALVVVADDIDGNALDSFIQNRLTGAFFSLCIKAPEYGERKEFWLEDIAKVTGATVVDDHHNYEEAVLGKAKKVLSSKDKTIIVGTKKVTEHVKVLEEKKKTQEGAYEIAELEKRIARLVGGVAVMKVGSASEEETRYMKLKLEDGVNETKRALEEGVVVGGDVAFINVTKGLKQVPVADAETLQGYNIIRNAVEAPFKQILENGREKSDEIIKKIKEDKSMTVGYDAVKRQIEPDMFEAGIIDALKVAKTVLKNALSSGYMCLTIERAVVDEPEKDGIMSGFIPMRM